MSISHYIGKSAYPRKWIWVVKRGSSLTALGLHLVDTQGKYISDRGNSSCQHSLSCVSRPILVPLYWLTCLITLTDSHSVRNRRLYQIVKRYFSPLSPDFRLLVRCGCPFRSPTRWVLCILILLNVCAYTDIPAFGKLPASISPPRTDYPAFQP